MVRERVRQLRTRSLLSWGSIKPCTATCVAALGMVGAPAAVRCGLLEGHAGDHEMRISWTDEPR